MPGPKLRPTASVSPATTSYKYHDWKEGKRNWREELYGCVYAWQFRVPLVVWSRKSVLTETVQSAPDSAGAGEVVETVQLPAAGYKGWGMCRHGATAQGWPNGWLPVLLGWRDSSLGRSAPPAGLDDNEYLDADGCNFGASVLLICGKRLRND